MDTVCLCGSTRFIKDFEQANIELTKRGLCIYTISMALPKGGEEPPGLKTMLDLVHLNKILASNSIVVVGDGYIGFSTAREIMWGWMHKKTLVSVESFDRFGSRTNEDFWDNISMHCRHGQSNLNLVVQARRVLNANS